MYGLAKVHDAEVVCGSYAIDDPGEKGSNDVFRYAIRSNGRRDRELSLAMHVLTIRTCDVLAIPN